MQGNEAIWVEGLKKKKTMISTQDFEAIWVEDFELEQAIQENSKPQKITFSMKKQWWTTQMVILH